MKAKELLEKLYAIGAVIRDSHIIYTSGRHGSAYVNKDAIYPHTELTRDICREIADRISDWQMEIVLAPALGGIILSQWVAFHLSRKKKKEILAIYAEKDETGETFVVRRGYDKLLNGKKVVVLEDVEQKFSPLAATHQVQHINSLTQ